MGRKKRFETSPAVVPRDLSDTEVKLKGKELADLCGEIDKIRADAADSASMARKKVRALEKRRRLLAECVRTSTEMIEAQLELGAKPKLVPPRTGDGGGPNGKTLA